MAHGSGNGPALPTPGVSGFNGVEADENVATIITAEIVNISIRLFMVPSLTIACE